MNENIYLGNNLGIRTIYFAITFFIDGVLAGTSAFVFPFTMLEYSSAAFGFFFCVAIGFGILAYLRFRGLLLIKAAKGFSEQFRKSTQPFLTISTLKTPLMRKWSNNILARKI
ncbi:MAG: hypothetical protein J5881_03360 [Clostridia bacterium]|nr:hypothetical protein [Clostridia bacterium]